MERPRALVAAGKAHVASIAGIGCGFGSGKVDGALPHAALYSVLPAPAKRHFMTLPRHCAASAASASPARLDLLQSLSGLALALFMWLHMAFVSSILISEDVAWAVARFFEGYFFLSRPQAWLVSAFAAAVTVLFAVHALLALRKFPADWRQYRIAASHGRRLRHPDTVLWFVQVATGFAMFFLAPVHLYTMLVHPDLIGPYESADRVWTGGFWPLYLALLFVVEVHGSVGLYRLAVKWGWFMGRDPRAGRRRLRRAMWALIVFLLALGLTTLAADIRLGIEHAPRAGERYVPSWERAGAAGEDVEKQQ
jgi:fumarate reductase subunit C